MLTSVLLFLQVSQQAIILNFQKPDVYLFGQSSMTSFG